MSVLQSSAFPEVRARDLPHPLPQLRRLRLSVTDLCNFRCRYCLPAGGVQKVDHHRLLRLEALAEQVAWLTANTAIDKICLTGGEPLVRPGIEHLIASLSSLRSVRDLCLTTNGSLLRGMAWALRAAGLRRVNISLDSLDEQRFAEVTRDGRLKNTLAGIAVAREAGLHPIKLNTALLRSTWRREIPDLLDYASENGFELRFIELMRNGPEAGWCASEFVSADEVRRGLASAFPCCSAAAPRTALVRGASMNWHGRDVAVDWISPQSRRLARRCEALHMDARGRLRRGPMDPVALDLPRMLEAKAGAAALDELGRYLAGGMPIRAVTLDLARERAASVGTAAIGRTSDGARRIGARQGAPRLAS